MPDQPHDPLTLDVLQANVRLLADKERLEEERRRLVELDQLKTEFLARVSHDLRTPLNSIIGFSDLMLTGVGGKLNRKHVEFTAAINRNGHVLLTLINDLLDLSTIEARQVTLRREHITLHALLDDLRAATTPVLHAAQVTPEWPDPAAIALKTAWIDQRRILQVLVNLVDNARKFTPAGGAVRIGMDADDEQAVFTVTDTGPGIPPADQQRIFQPFFQRSANVQSHAGGVGLGLVIVKSIVELHHGSIALDSDVGRGCTFRIVIPQQVAAMPIGP